MEFKILELFSGRLAIPGIWLMNIFQDRQFIYTLNTLNLKNLAIVRNVNLQLEVEVIKPLNLYFKTTEYNIVYPKKYTFNILHSTTFILNL